MTELLFCFMFLFFYLGELGAIDYSEVANRMFIIDSDRDTCYERLFGSRHHCLSVHHCRMA
jgi:hypothetical protein